MWLQATARTTPTQPTGTKTMSVYLSDVCNIIYVITFEAVYAMSTQYLKKSMNNTSGEPNHSVNAITVDANETQMLSSTILV